jgi:LDH2 family malate/lactate/ureidoglycolate dehydrogenase
MASEGDMPTSMISMQNVRMAAQAGTPMPEGLIFDRAGRPTVDPGRFSREG